MNRLPFILPAIAVAVLAGCATATESGISSAPAPVVTPPAAAAAPAAPAAPTYSVGAAGTTVVVPNASAAPTAKAPAAAPLRVGFGRIDSILVVPNAAAGGTAPNITNKRITMRMDDGTLQNFDTQADNLKVGDRIEITTNGTMRHPV